MAVVRATWVCQAAWFAATRASQITRSAGAALALALAAFATGPTLAAGLALALAARVRVPASPAVGHQLRERVGVELAGLGLDR